MKTKLLSIWTATLLALTWSTELGAAQTNLVQDGSFEFPRGTVGYRTGRMGAWTVRASADVVGIYEADHFPGANVTEGNQGFDLGMGLEAQGNSISQVLPTIAGQPYRLSFDWGSEYAKGTIAYVSVGNLEEVLEEPDRSVDPTDYSTPWIVNSANFLFVAFGNDTLKFGELANPVDRWGLVLDNIRVISALPQLTLISTGPDVILTWPGDATGFNLESTTDLASPATWIPVSQVPELVNGQYTVTIPISGAQQFFRLSQ